MWSYLIYSSLFTAVLCGSKYVDLENLVHTFSKYPLLMESFEHNKQIFGGKYDQNVFPCDPLKPSPTVPTSVHKLRPGDIKVVASLGDSLTAGNGITAKTIFGVLREDRGLSFSIGGDGSFEDAITIPNILKKFNPNIKGFSTRSGKVDSKYSNLNVAVPGNVFGDMVDEANDLVARMKAESSIDINNDWKLVTILIGDNDLCDICSESGKGASHLVANMEKALNILQQNLPRTLVNIVEVLNVEMVRKLNKGIACTVLHFFLCKCAAFPKNDDAKAELRNYTRSYQLAMRDLASSGKYDTKDDFTIVDQPFFRDTYLPRKSDGKTPDLSYFAPDCFHLSEKGHADTAVALWNNMLQPVGGKATKWTLGEVIGCPTEESPYIFTNQNSKKFEY